MRDGSRDFDPTSESVKHVRLAIGLCEYSYLKRKDFANVNVWKTLNYNDNAISLEDTATACNWNFLQNASLLW